MEGSAGSSLVRIFVQPDAAIAVLMTRYEAPPGRTERPFPGAGWWRVQIMAWIRQIRLIWRWLDRPPREAPGLPDLARIPPVTPLTALTAPTLVSLACVTVLR
jgi:hypothetical protein